MLAFRQGLKNIEAIHGTLECGFEPLPAVPCSIEHNREHPTSVWLVSKKWAVDRLLRDGTELFRNSLVLVKAGVLSSAQLAEVSGLALKKLIYYLGDFDGFDLASFLLNQAGLSEHGVKLVYAGVDREWFAQLRRFQCERGLRGAFFMAPAAETETAKFVCKCSAQLAEILGEEAQACLHRGEKAELEGLLSEDFWDAGCHAQVSAHFRRFLRG